MPVRPDVLGFLERYTDASNALDPVGLSAAFDDVFLSLEPNAARALERERLIATLPMRRQMLDAIGAAGADLTSAHETVLDDQHTLVAATWEMRFRPGSGQPPMTLKSTFLLRRQEGRWQIVVYLDHRDLAAEMQARRPRTG